MLRQQVVQNESALQQNVELRALLDYNAPPTFPGGYRGVAAEVDRPRRARSSRRSSSPPAANDGVRVERAGRHERRASSAR